MAAALILVFVVAGIVFFVRARSAGSGLAGGVFTDKPQAPEFSLKDQNGQTVTMSQLKGKVVALTPLRTQWSIEIGHGCARGAVERGRKR